MTPDPATASTRVEAYLDQLLVPLTHNLSDFHRDELRRELRAHLQGRVDAYRELDYSEDDAVTEALKQFGSAEDFFKQWRREWMQAARPDAWQEILAATRSALRLTIPALVVTWVVAYVLGNLAIKTLPTLCTGNSAQVCADILLTIVCGGFFGLSLWVGIVQGRRTPRRSGWGMLAALGTVVTVGSASSLIGTIFGLEGTLCSGFYTSMPLMAAAWIPTTCFAAAVSGWWTQRSRKRRRIA